jgi:GT2 family glycosyltransferase
VGAVDDALVRQVDAVVRQVLPQPFEVILSVNVPHAGTLELLTSRWVGQHRCVVRAIDSSDRRGAAHARNVGAAAAAAELLAFCDADDVVHPGWLAELVAALDTFEAVSGNVVDVFPAERMASWHPPTTPGGLPTFLDRPYVLTGNLGVRRSAFEAVGGFDESLTRCEDIAFGWALTSHGFSIGFAPEAVLSYYHRPGLRAMLRQHYLYGRGMSETLVRYGSLPTGGKAGTARLYRANAQPVARRTVGGAARRGAIALGRLRGLAGERLASHKVPTR